MSIQFEVDVRPDYVCLSCTGIFTSDAFLEVLKEGLIVSASKEFVAMLIDTRGLVGEPPSTMERFATAEAIPGMQRKYSTRTRIAVVGDEPMIDPQRFGETVAINRGASAKVFTDFDEATTWLRDHIDERRDAKQSPQGTR